MCAQGQTMFEQTFKNLDDTLWKDARCGTELEYEELTLSKRSLNQATQTLLVAPSQLACINSKAE